MREAYQIRRQVSMILILLINILAIYSCSVHAQAARNPKYSEFKEPFEQIFFLKQNLKGKSIKCQVRNNVGSLTTAID